MLNERCVQIVLNLANNKNSIKISEIAEEYNVSNRTVRYDLDSIDQYLEENNLHKIERKPNVGIILTANAEEKRKLVQKLKTINEYNYVLSPDERKNLILSELIQQSGYITINQLADEIMVSRGTLIRDLSNVRQWLEENALELKSVSKHGIRIAGDEKNLRQATMDLLRETIDINKVLDFIEFPKNKIINVYMGHQLEKFFNGIDIGFIENSLKIAESELQSVFSDDAFIALIIQIAISIKRIKLSKEVEITNSELNLLGITKEFVTASNLARMFEEHFEIDMSIYEIGYLALNLLGSSVSATVIIEKEHWIDFQILTRDIIKSVGTRSNIEFYTDKQLFDGFLEHLRPAIYRIRNKLKVKNPLLKDIKIKFSNLFEDVKASIKPIEDYAGGTFDDEEIGYLSMYFGASMERINTYNTDKKNLLIVCGEGIGTAKLISAKIQSLFDVNIVGTVAYRQMNTILKQEDIDLIVSTFQVNVDGVISIKVEPILTDMDISLLNNYLRRLKVTKTKESEIIKIIKKHCVINDIDGLTKDLSRMFNINDYNFTKGVVQPMLKDLLTDKTIKLKVDATDWEDCVKKGGELLKQNGCIESRYIDAMINSVKDIGPYIVIAPGIAMPHARPEAGTKKIGLSLITLKNPINFGNKDNDPVRIVVCLCATDHYTHIKAMSELVTLLGDDEKVDKINAAENISDILCLLENEEK